MYTYYNAVVVSVCIQAAREDIAMIKVVAPQMVQRVVDRAIQVCIIGSLCIIIQLATEVSPPGRVEFVCIENT